MKILTMYSADALKLLDVFDTMVSRKNTIKVLATEPNRLYNDDNHDDVNMASITFYSDEDVESVKEFIFRNDVFVCEEDSSDWE
ncbi:hypothetical protein DLB11_24520 [Salmonella enterica subsp. enterica serovar Kentucky]|nr:hypothetical protein [Salmonella enterica subsp. enterica serovar Kentucky]